MRSYLRFWILFLSIVVLDQWTKSWVVSRSSQLRENPILLLDFLDGEESFLEITYVTNPGAAWSMLSDYPQFLTVLAMVALVAIFFFRRQLELIVPLHQIVFGLICGGILGNLLDRLFREPAEVVDFIDVFIPLINYDYPIFNIADSAIFIGAIMYFIIGLKESRKELRLKPTNS